MLPIRVGRRTERSLSRVMSESLCSLCKRQFSRYTCPTCNVPYCSLACFRSQAHSQCSETFYKKELEDDIRGEPSKTAQERQQMLQLLKRFEEESAEQDEVEAEEVEDSDFLTRFQDLDLDATNSDQLWSLLKPEERERFLKAMEDPSNELATQLLASEDLERDKLEPWWTAPTLLAESSSQRRFGVPPEPIQIPSFLKIAQSKCIAYAYITRHLSVSPLSNASELEIEAARDLFAQLTPFLTSRTSKTLLPSLDNAITDMHSRLPSDSASPGLFALILHDAVTLLRPALTAQKPRTSAPIVPSETCTRYSSPRAHVAHKITFYAASLGKSVARLAAMELDAAAKTREAELKGAETHEKVEWERLGEAKAMPS
ncbi:hypothetical protein C8F01DRAFT_1211213 [Mycena amicta]|nr:hypothetical protein C8F01DRAFT_1211213 [Mycena amicta]